MSVTRNCLSLHIGRWICLESEGYCFVVDLTVGVGGEGSHHRHGHGHDRPHSVHRDPRQQHLADQQADHQGLAQHQKAQTVTSKGLKPCVVRLIFWCQCRACSVHYFV